MAITSDMVIEQFNLAITNADMQPLLDSLAICRDERNVPPVVALRYAMISHFANADEKQIVQFFAPLLTNIKTWNADYSIFKYDDFLLGLLSLSWNAPALKQYLLRVITNEIENNTFPLKQTFEDWRLLQWLNSNSADEVKLAVLILNKFTVSEFESFCDAVAAHKLKYVVEKLKTCSLKHALPDSLNEVIEPKKVYYTSYTSISDTLPSLLTSKDPIINLETALNAVYEKPSGFYMQMVSSQKIDKTINDLFNVVLNQVEKEPTLVKNIKNKELVLEAVARRYKIRYKSNEVQDFVYALCKELGYKPLNIVDIAIKYSTSDYDYTHLLASVINDSGPVLAKVPNWDVKLFWAALEVHNFALINYVIQLIGEERVKNLINQSDPAGNTPAHHITHVRTNSLDAALQLFVRLGANFNVTNKAGLFPTQSHYIDNLGSERAETFKKYNIINLPTLTTIIQGMHWSDYNEEQLRRALKTYPKEHVQSVFTGRGGSFYSPSDPNDWKGADSASCSYFQEAIFYNRKALLNVYIECLLENNIFTSEQTLKILKDGLKFGETIPHRDRSHDSEVLNPLKKAIEKCTNANSLKPGLAFTLHAPNQNQIQDQPEPEFKVEYSGPFCL